MIVPALNNAVKSLLSRAGVDNPAGDTAEIMCAVLECDRTQLILKQDDVPDTLCDKALQMARRRTKGEPIQYIIGTWSFMGRDYKVGKGVLIPRDDTEVVVRQALRLIKPIPRPQIVDLCAGSGVIAITLYKELPGAAVFAVEKSGEAFAYLAENARLNQADIRPVHADLADCADSFTDSSLDMIVSNPPYICTDEIAALQSEVQYEPKLALDGGKSGYDFYEIILDLWSKKLRIGGFIAFEIGEGQFGCIRELMRDHGFADIVGYPDIQGITRAITGKRVS